MHSQQTNEILKQNKDVHTDTDRQNDYRNPRCACAPRVISSIVWGVCEPFMRTDAEGASLENEAKFVE